MSQTRKAVRGGSNTAESLRDFTCEDIRRADLCLTYFANLRGIELCPLYVEHMTVGMYLSGVFYLYGVLALCRLYDQRRDARTASLKNLLAHAGGRGNVASQEELREKLRSNAKYLRAVRNGFLAHMDMELDEFQLNLARTMKALGEAKEIHRAAVKVLWPRRQSAYSHPRVEVDAAAFAELLREWKPRV